MEAQYGTDADEAWFAGKVMAVNVDGTCDVHYEDGDTICTRHYMHYEDGDKEVGKPWSRVRAAAVDVESGEEGELGGEGEGGDAKGKARQSARGAAPRAEDIDDRSDSDSDGSGVLSDSSDETYVAIQDASTGAKRRLLKHYEDGDKEAGKPWSRVRAAAVDVESGETGELEREEEEEDGELEECILGEQSTFEIEAIAALARCSSFAAIEDGEE